MKTLSDMRSHPRFDELRQLVENAGSDSKEFFGGTINGGYHVQQNPDEFAALLCYLLERCRTISLYGEIGVAAGGTTRLIYEVVGFVGGILIDNGVHPKHQHFKDNTAAFADRLEVLIGDSHSKEVRNELGWNMPAVGQFDVVFIDGDHSYEGVKQDIELVRPYCTGTTLAIFHDTIICDGVKQAFNELPDRVAEFVGDQKQFGIGIARIGASHAVCQ